MAGTSSIWDMARCRCQEAGCRQDVELPSIKAAVPRSWILPWHFIATPDNPVPAIRILVSVTTRDGMTLRAAYWMPETEAPQGTVCILQGRAEFIEKYFEVGGRTARRGLCRRRLRLARAGPVGPAGQNPRKGHVRRFPITGTTSKRSATRSWCRTCPEPHFALAHSMGGAIALNAAYESLAALPPPRDHHADDRRYASSSARGLPPSWRGSCGVSGSAAVRPRRRRDIDFHPALQGQSADQRS